MMDLCEIIELPKIKDSRGNLTYIESSRQIPFEIARVYYIYDVPGGSERGGHAHKKLQQLIIAISGSFNVLLDDGVSRKSYLLNRADRGLYMAPMMWRELSDFSSGSVCMVLASAPYDETDYFRDYESFVKAVK